MTPHEFIKKLGGYEKAKDHRNYLISYGSEFGHVSTQEVDSLNDSLLEYRRENNIFEVEDLVVKSKRLNDDKVYKISEIASTQNWIKTSCGVFIDAPMFRHATPEEIKTGHRL